MVNVLFIFTAVKGLADVNRKKQVEELLPVSGRGDREDERSRVRHTGRYRERVRGERHFSTEVNIRMFHAIAERTHGAV